VGEAAGAGGKKRAISAGVTGESRIFRPPGVFVVFHHPPSRKSGTLTFGPCPQILFKKRRDEKHHAGGKRTSLIGQQGISLTTLSYLLKKT